MNALLFLQLLYRRNEQFFREFYMSCVDVGLNRRHGYVLCLQKLGAWYQKVVFEVKFVVIHLSWHDKAVGTCDLC